MLQIALPNKGALSEEAVRLVADAGYRCRRYGRELAVHDEKNDIDFIFLRPRDIAVYVSHGVLDMGITGRDLVRDGESDVVEVLALGFGRSRFCYAVPADSTLTPDQFTHLRIATSYPKLVEQDMRKRGISAHIVRLDGAVEIAVDLGVSDAIADVVESGRTLREAGLKIVGDPVLLSEAVLICREKKATGRKPIKTFIERLRGIIVARTYVMVEYDAPRTILDQVCAVTPGIESPTVSPLAKQGWLAVKAMVKKEDINRVMDDLAKLGAKGIVVMDIRTSRI
jgi:ATP phosphoribosyltransferase